MCQAVTSSSAAARLAVAGVACASSVDTLKKYKEKPVVVYCDTGTASAAAARLLKAQGFAKVVNLRGGVQAWKQDNLPLVKDPVKGNGRSQSGKGDKGAKTA